MIRQLYEKFNKGIKLSNQELRTLRQHFRAMERLLSECGPIFHLAWQEAASAARVLDDYFKARGLKEIEVDNVAQLRDNGHIN